MIDGCHSKLRVITSTELNNQLNKQKFSSGIFEFIPIHSTTLTHRSNWNCSISGFMFALKTVLRKRHFSKHLGFYKNSPTTSSHNLHIRWPCPQIAHIEYPMWTDVTASPKSTVIILLTAPEPIQRNKLLFMVVYLHLLAELNCVRSEAYILHA